jgi:hypothetical protein
MVKRVRGQADPKKPYKALGGAVAALVGTVLTAWADRNITGEEAGWIGGSVVAVGVLVYAIRNPKVP